MEVEIIGVFIPIITVIAITILIIYLRKYENEERMAMIDKGMNPMDLKKMSSIERNKGPRNTSYPLRLSLLMIGGGLGLLVAYFLDRTFYMEEVAYFSMLFVFGGIGLGLSYIIEEKKNKEL